MAEAVAQKWWCLILNCCARTDLRRTTVSMMPATTTHILCTQRNHVCVRRTDPPRPHKCLDTDRDFNVYSHDIVLLHQQQYRACVPHCRFGPARLFVCLVCFAIRPARGNLPVPSRRCMPVLHAAVPRPAVPGGSRRAYR